MIRAFCVKDPSGELYQDCVYWEERIARDATHLINRDEPGHTVVPVTITDPLYIV